METVLAERAPLAGNRRGQSQPIVNGPRWDATRPRPQHDHAIELFPALSDVEVPMLIEPPDETSDVPSDEPVDVLAAVLVRQVEAECARFRAVHERFYARMLHRLIAQDAHTPTHEDTHGGR